MRTKPDPQPVYQPREAYTGPQPTIGDYRRKGMRRLSVHCIELGLCGHVATFTFEVLKLPDDMTFLDVPKHRRFLCSRCGGRRVEISPDWTDVRHAGDGRP